MDNIFTKDNTSILGFLKESIEELIDIANLFNDYYEKLAYTNFSGSRPYETQLLLKHIKHVTTEKTTAKYMRQIVTSGISFDTPKISESKSFSESVMSFYFNLMDNHYSMLEVYEIYDGHQIEISTGSFMSSATSMSTRQVEEIIAAYEMVKTRWNSHMTRIHSKSMEFILSEFIITMIENLEVDNRIKLLEHVKSLYEKVKHGLIIIELYSMILERILSTIDTSSNREVIKYIMNLVEELKEKSLPAVPRLISNRKKNTVQQLVQRHRLIPDGVSRSLEILIKNLASTKIASGKVIPQLEKVAKSISKKGRSYGFVVISKTISNPIEHNIWLLSDTQYLQQHGLLTDATAGINEKTLDRSKTISYMGDVDTTMDKLTEGVYHIAPESDYFYILETLDGNSYRILYPWYISIFTQKKIYEIPKSLLKDFAVKENPSTRLESYTSIINAEIMSFVKKPRVEEKLSRLEKKQKEVQWNVIRKKITRYMLEDYKDLLDQRKINKDTIVSIILDPIVFNNSIRYIMNTIGEMVSDDIDKYASELYLSTMQHLYKLKTEMAQDVSSLYFEKYASDIEKLLQGTVSSKTKFKIIDTLETILMAVLENHITKKSNVYLSVQEKINLLEQTSR